MSPIHPNLKLLSNNSSVLSHKCPRKYELYKLWPPEQSTEDEDDEHLNFGTVVGLGVQEYLRSSDERASKFYLFMAWNKFLDDAGGERSKKTFWHALHALERFIGFRKTALSKFKLAYFNGQPATELGFSIDCGDGWFYRGFLDALLIDETNNELCVYEGKTTKNKDIHEAVYKHSGQGLGYSLLIDALAKLLGFGSSGSSFKVRYAIYKSFAYDWELLVFNKTFTQRALWIKNIMLDKERITKYAEDGYFPMYGENCYDFFRPCKYFGICEMSNKYLVGENPVVKVDDESKYPFKFNLMELIEAQLEKQEA